MIDSAIHFLETHQLMTFIAVFFGGIPVLFALKILIWKKLRSLAKKTETQIDDDLIEKTTYPLRLIIILLSLQVALHFAPDWLAHHKYVDKGTKIILGLSLVWILERFVYVLLTHLSAFQKMGHTNKSLVITFSRFIILSIGTVWMLDNLGISITPILASLGVSSLAVALALQDTLSNFFSGLYLQFDQPIKMGDFVRLEDGSEGHIKKIGWRTTQIVSVVNNTIIIPNTKLSSSTLINYELPHPGTLITLPLGVAYDSNLEQVEKLTIETTKKILLQTEGGDKNFTPYIRFTQFADSSINFNIILRVQHWTDQHLVKHELIKAIHQAFAHHKIEIPFPQRTVYLQQEKLS